MTARARLSFVVCLLLGVVAAARSAPDFDALPADARALLAAAEPLWPTLAPAARAQLQRNAADWLARPPAQREALRARLRQWDALPAAERARRRAPFAAWQQLSPGEQQRLRAAAAELAALPAERQQAMLDAFRALPADTQRAWWLGPDLGRDAVRFGALFAFVPEDQRPALLAMLRDLPVAAGDDLARLLPRLDPAAREQLRQALLAAAPDQRADVIRARLK